jgi:aminoglycoside phosphotransferase (APT) family kinase protein
MRSGRKRRLERHQVDALLESAGVGPDAVLDCVAVGGGTFNTVYRLRLADGGGAVLKLAPATDDPIMGYERGILRTEARFYQHARRHTAVPVPAVLRTGSDRHVAGDYLLMSELPGSPWHGHGHGRLRQSDRQRLRYELGTLVAELHTVTGGVFGYPEEPVAPLNSSWRAALLAMVSAVLDDAERFSVRLPRPTAWIRDAVQASSEALDEVRTPVLVHFDLWDGNILLDVTSGSVGIGGLIDAERAFWGDPAADFVSLALFQDIERDPAFLAGYRAGGGQVEFGEPLRRRLRLYRIYLYLIMVVEATPRGYAGPEHDRMHRRVTDLLRADLDGLDSPAASLT